RLGDDAARARAGQLDPGRKDSRHGKRVGARRQRGSVELEDSGVACGRMRRIPVVEPGEPDPSVRVAADLEETAVMEERLPAIDEAREIDCRPALATAREEEHPAPADAVALRRAQERPDDSISDAHAVEDP